MSFYGNNPHYVPTVGSLTTNCAFHNFLSLHSPKESVYLPFLSDVAATDSQFVCAAGADNDLRAGQRLATSPTARAPTTPAHVQSARRYQQLLRSWHECCKCGELETTSFAVEGAVQVSVRLYDSIAASSCRDTKKYRISEAAREAEVTELLKQVAEAKASVEEYKTRNSMLEAQVCFVIRPAE